MLHAGLVPSPLHVRLFTQALNNIKTHNTALSRICGLRAVTGARGACHYEQSQRTECLDGLNWLRGTNARPESSVVVAAGWSEGDYPEPPLVSDPGHNEAIDGV